MTFRERGDGDTIGIEGGSIVSAIISQGKIITSRKQAIEGIINNTTDDNDSAKDQEMQRARFLRIEADGREQYFSLRRVWSAFIIIWITVLIIFNIVLPVLIGLGYLSFENMQEFASNILSLTFLQIVGLGYVAVRFLFSHR